MLIRHYRDPMLFEWVQLESDDPSARSLDDVVAKRMDGSVEYTQVKFTVNPAEYPLDWDYLLTKKPNGTSMLAKWASSFARAKENGVIHSAQLKTNRIPSPDFAACMNGTTIDLSKVPASVLALVETECGGQAQATAFFGTFAFTAGHLDLDRLESSLRDQLIPTDTDNLGWLLLREEVTRWAIHQRQPPPDGKILREHVVRLISKKRPRPMRQDFFVPEGYAPPNLTFNNTMVARVKNPKTPLTVLWGTPGRGKSTYLSYLTDKLKSEGDAVLRHHYFLTSDDSSANRASYADIAASLYDQLFSHYAKFTTGVTDKTENLRSDLKIAASNLSRQSNRLYLIVDGLDHVYRDTRRTDQINHLFNVLFPLPEGISLIVGTQRVADDQLPTKLLLSAENDDWIEIPRMDEVAVRRWLQMQDGSRPVAVRWYDRRSEEIDKIGAALFKISQGHPLHLIYAFENLIRSGEPVDEDTVLALPACPDGDIRSYYNNLWLRIGAQSRIILHMLAGSDFFWPTSGIRQCIGEYDEISFLLERNYSGIIPFHNSIFAWVRQRGDHEENYKTLLPRIVSWLEMDAPDYWRWGWLWLAKAEAGNTSSLLIGATRVWAVDSLVNGWPESQIENILAAAEKLTFAGYDLAATVRLRALKTLVSNIREYQAWNFGAFRAAALSIADNQQQVRNLLDSLENLTIDELAALSRHGPKALRKELADGCYEELARRINTWIELRQHPADDIGDLLVAFLKVAALCGEERVPRVVSFLKRLKKPSLHIRRYIEFLAELHDIRCLYAVEKLLVGSKWRSHRREIQAHILRSALFLGADPLQCLKRGRFKHGPFVAGWLSLKSLAVRHHVEVSPILPNLLRDRTSSADNADLLTLLVDAFWITLRANKTRESDCSLIYQSLDRGKLGFIDLALDCLEECAARLAEEDMPWSFSTPFLIAADVPKIPFTGRTETDWVQYNGFRQALNMIALDVHLIGLANQDALGISAEDLSVARASVHWVDQEWINANVESRIPYLSMEAARVMLDEMTSDLASRISLFNDRADEWTKYASLAHLYGVNDPVKLIRRAATSLLGYGYRKDMFVFEVLASIGDVHKADTHETERWLTRVTPIVDCITDFTDGDETRHARSQLVDVVANTHPSLLPKFYRHHLDNDEWSYADQCLKSFIKSSDLDGPEAAGLVGTLLDPETLGELQKRAKHDSVMQALLEKQATLLGGLPASTERDYSTPQDGLRNAQENALSLEATSFGPDDFAGVAEAVSAPAFHYAKRKPFLTDWLRHWHGKRKSRQAIASVRAYFDSGRRTYDVEEILDTTFEVSLAAEGRDAAYPWLVEGHRRRHGWSSYFTSKDEIEARLRAAANIYPDRWKEFIRDTSTPTEFYSRRGYSFSIGFHHLVWFLLLADQTQEAKKVTSEFISILEAETEDQPIAEAVWLR